MERDYAIKMLEFLESTRTFIQEFDPELWVLASPLGQLVLVDDPLLRGGNFRKHMYNPIAAQMDVRDYEELRALAVETGTLIPFPTDNQLAILIRSILAGNGEPVSSES